MNDLRHPELRKFFDLDAAESPENGTATVSEQPAGRPLPATRHSPLPSIPGYEILKRLGRGGMGIVFLAREIAVGRLIALKLIRTGQHADEVDLDRFHSEAASLAELEHPHIVRLYHYGIHEGQPFFTLEYCQGDSLARRMDGAPVSPTLAARMVEQLANAIGVSHRRDIIHRDLKPSNVLLVESPETPLELCTLKISDFGLAKRLDSNQDHTQSDAALGTPQYMAPEQTNDAKNVGPAADIYSLGVILYELLTGRPPFRAATAADTLIQIRSLDPVSLRQLVPQIPRDLETICLKCLDKDPLRRFTAAEFAADLGRFQRNEPIYAQTASSLKKVHKWVRRNKAAATIIAALTVAVAGMGTTAMYASKAAAVAHEKLIAGRLSSANLAKQRGDWREVIRIYDEVANQGHVEDAQMQLNRAKGYLALMRRPDARRLLDTLYDVKPDDGIVAEVELLRGELLFAAGDSNGEQLIRNSLSHSPAPAVEFYARGFLANSATEALSYFRQSLAEDPSRVDTWMQTAFFQTILGELTEARVTVGLATDTFSTLPQFSILALIIDVLRENRIAFDRSFSRLEQLRSVDPLSLTRLRELPDLFTPIAQRIRTLGSDYSPTEIQMNEIRNSFQKLRMHLLVDTSGENSGSLLGFTLPPCLRKALQPLLHSDFSAFLTSGEPSEPFLGQLKTTMEIIPEATFCFLHGAAQFIHAPGFNIDTATNERAVAEYRATCESLMRGLKSRSIFEIRSSTLDILMFSEAVLSIPEYGSRVPALAKEAAIHAKQRLALGTTGWDRNVAGVTALAAVAADDYELARFLLFGVNGETQRGQTDSKIIPKVCLETGAYSAAIRSAKERLKKKNLPVPEIESLNVIIEQASSRLEAEKQ